MKSSDPFPNDRKYIATRLGFDSDYPMIANEPLIVETDRRINREHSFSFVRVLWWFRFKDEPPVISVPIGAKEFVGEWLSRKCDLNRLPLDDEANELMEIINRHHERRKELLAIKKSWHKIFLCNKDTIRENIAVASPASLIRIDRQGLRYAESIYVPEHCIPDGVAFGVSVDEKIVSVSVAHRTALMENVIADLGIETAELYRKRGYARAAVHAVANHFISKGGEAWYECSPGNIASQATARSVGFVELAESLSLRTANMVDEE